jgi:hypothetical protein
MSRKARIRPKRASGKEGEMYNINLKTEQSTL